MRRPSSRRPQIAADPASVVWLEVTPDEMRQLGPLLDLHPQAVDEVLVHAENDGAHSATHKDRSIPARELLYLYRAEVEAAR